jgi:hypothetical protein
MLDEERKKLNALLKNMNGADTDADTDTDTDTNRMPDETNLFRSSTTNEIKTITTIATATTSSRWQFLITVFCPGG